MENTPLKRADPEEEAAFFNDDGEAVEKDEGSSEKPAEDGEGCFGRWCAVRALLQFVLRRARQVHEGHVQGVLFVGEPDLVASAV